MNPQRFAAILAELLDENPFALRAVVKILQIEYTSEVETMAVTRDARPRLLVNLEFVRQHCKTDDEVKAVLCHEFLHVLLNHTEQLGRLTKARHIALDAVINAIIHREHGKKYSSMMSRYYASSMGPMKILRPMTGGEEMAKSITEVGARPPPAWHRSWVDLYRGTLVADDIEAIVGALPPRQSPRGGRVGPGDEAVDGPLEGIASGGTLLGNHRDLGEAMPEVLRDALDEALKQMNGAGIWRSPKSRGTAANSYSVSVFANQAPTRRWQKAAYEVLRNHLLPDRTSRIRAEEPYESRIPVLSPSDRRAFLRATWSEIIPDAIWIGTRPQRSDTANVYLDVSGSMDSEMPLIIAVLHRLSRCIRRPFWAFSDKVVPAVIEKGQLRADTTSGTSLSCVLAHIEKTRPPSAVIVTDGYIEGVPIAAVRRVQGTRLHALVTRDGDRSVLMRLGIPCTQLGKVPA